LQHGAGGAFPRRFMSAGRLGVVVGLIGLVATGSLAWTARALNRSNEHRLLQIQTAQAGALIASSILGIEAPLATALQIETATGGNAAEFTRFMASYTGPGKLFVSASVWRADGAGTRIVTSIGQPAKLDTVAAEALVAKSFGSSTFVATGIPANTPQAIGFALANPASPAYAIYAERAIPANRKVEVESNSAFSDLRYATYLGTTTNPSQLTTTDVSPSQLPLKGAERIAVPFGDTTVTLVAAPVGHLGGSLGANLPWIVLALGVALTITSAFVAVQLASRRREAERNSETISGLYSDLDRLYAEQRTIAVTLQRALLPRRIPSIDNLEIASRYVAGADGVDVGGDWYSLVQIDDQRFGFVVGDVSGRGVGAATIMAQLRYTVRAYLLEGHGPGAVLGMCSGQLDIDVDGHFATVLVGVGDLGSREITIANAGHMNPLLVAAAGETSFVDTTVGPPIGIGSSTYAETTVAMAPGSTLLAFTDGLIERRGEDIDRGFERLADAATEFGPTLDGVLSRLLTTVAEDTARDDIAILAFRWIDAQSPDSVSISASESRV
ncbi:MAG TPA: SpoIIE family protein phosphatase, partial [Acidothermaceae bacterium]|nr:SpoIIE family protein phosphatase [Acidothermaceae bacterium]